MLRQRGKLPIEITLTFKPKHGKKVATPLYVTLVLKHHNATRSASRPTRPETFACASAAGCGQVRLEPQDQSQSLVDRSQLTCLQPSRRSAEPLRIDHRRLLDEHPRLERVDGDHGAQTRGQRAR
jgi:hypothetical protein